MCRLHDGGVECERKLADPSQIIRGAHELGQFGQALDQLGLRPLCRARRAAKP